MLGTARVLYAARATRSRRSQSEVPEELTFGADATPEQLATAGEQLYNGAAAARRATVSGHARPTCSPTTQGTGAIGARCGTREAGGPARQYSVRVAGRAESCSSSGLPADHARHAPQAQNDQIWATVAFLESQGGEVDGHGDRTSSRRQRRRQRPRQRGAPAASRSRDDRSGRACRSEKGCVGCHKLGGEGRERRSDRSITSARGLTPRAIRQRILDPARPRSRRASSGSRASMPQELRAEAHRGPARGAGATSWRARNEDDPSKYSAHPFWQAVGLLVFAFVLIKCRHRVPPAAARCASAPVPTSVVLQYMLIGAGRHPALRERQRGSLDAVQGSRSTTLLVSHDRRIVRTGAAGRVPAALGFSPRSQARPSVAAPPNLRSIHPAPRRPDHLPRQDDAASRDLNNPLRAAAVDGGALRGGQARLLPELPAVPRRPARRPGPLRARLQPDAADFHDNGTIAQLTESFVFWRIAKGGPGLPQEGTPWNSAMPVWEDFLTEDEIWAVIIFLYEQTGWQPRRWRRATELRRRPTHGGGAHESRSAEAIARGRERRVRHRVACLADLPCAPNG